MDAVPELLELPDGSNARYVPNSYLDTGRAQYTIAGQLTDLDVTIPADLAGWYWSGAVLVAPDRTICLPTHRYGLPGVFVEARRRASGYKTTPPPLDAGAGALDQWIALEAQAWQAHNARQRRHGPEDGPDFWQRHVAALQATRKWALKHLDQAAARPQQLVMEL